MDAYSGYEPQVGEIYAIRTFRIGRGGRLYPLFSNTPWTAATNTCRCGLPLPTGATGPAHVAPDPDCSCGYYAYADESSAAEYPHARHVLAVVACWGRIIAGTRGVRAQHARIAAIWVSDRVPADLRADVAVRYPSAPLYTDRAAMLREHPATTLDCFDASMSRANVGRRRIRHTIVVAALLVGSLPAGWIWHHDDVRLVWMAELAAFLIAAMFLRLGRDDRSAHRTALLYAATTLWLLAPFAGGAGVLMFRLPILQIGLLGGLHRAQLTWRAGRFPADIPSA